MEGGNEPYRREKAKKTNCYLPGKIYVTNIINGLTERKTLQEVRELAKGEMLLGTHENIFDGQLKTLAFILGSYSRVLCRTMYFDWSSRRWLCLLCGNRLAEVEQELEGRH